MTFLLLTLMTIITSHLGLVAALASFGLPVHFDPIILGAFRKSFHHISTALYVQPFLDFLASFTSSLTF